MNTKLTPEGHRLANALVKADHEFKAHPTVFHPARRGDKTFEFRKDDRGGYHVGQTVCLRCYAPETGYTDDAPLYRVITDILRPGEFGLQDGYCILSLRPLTAPEGTRARLREAWRCPNCRCHTFAEVAKQKPDGSFGPGPLVRCVNCKGTFPTPLASPQPAVEGPVAAGVGWRPIETAPKDGTHILVARTASKPIRAWFSYDRWWMHGCGPLDNRPADLTGAYAPTHWIPLPAAPVATLTPPADPKTPDAGVGGTSDRLTNADQLRIAACYHRDKLPAGLADELLSLADEWTEEVDTLRSPKTPDAATGGSVGDGGLREAIGESAFVYILADKTDLDGELHVTRWSRQSWRNDPKFEPSIRDLAYRIADDAIALAQPAPVGGIRSILTEARSGLHAFTGGDDGACGATIARIDAVLRGLPAPVGEDETGVREALKKAIAERDAAREEHARAEEHICNLEILAYIDPEQTWKDAAIKERVARVAAERALAPQPPKAETPAGVGDMDRGLWLARDFILGAHAFYSPETGSVVTGAAKDAIAAIDAVLSTAPAARPGDGVGLTDIAAERRRQIEAEGWTPEHDDTHAAGEIARAAAAYAMAGAKQTDFLRENFLGEWDHGKWSAVRSQWPSGWDWSWFKPTTPRRDLVKAGALIVAEIERLDRAALAAAAPAADGGRA